MALTIQAPTFRCIPCFVVGIPVRLANLCFSPVIPNARFHEKLSPGMIDFFLPMVLLTNNITIRKYVKNLLLPNFHLSFYTIVLLAWMQGKSQDKK